MQYCDELICYAYLPCVVHRSLSFDRLRVQFEAHAPSLTLASSPEQGRYVVVREGESVAPQSLLMCAQRPFAFGLDPKFVLTTCSHCFSVSVTPFDRKCLGCEASAWCSAQCQEQDQNDHSVVCEALRCVRERKREFPDSASLVVRALVRNKTESLLEYGLVDGGDLDTKQVYAQCLLRTLPLSFLKEFNASEELVKRILNISTFNSFGLYDGRFAEEDMADCRRGQALYPWLAYFNHSCVPNAAFMLSKGGTFLVLALEELRPGDRVHLRYGGPLDDDAVLRRRHLAEKYGFWCECARCVADADCRIQADCPCLCGGIALRDPISQTTMCCTRRCAPSMHATRHTAPPSQQHHHHQGPQDHQEEPLVDEDCTNP